MWQWTMHEQGRFDEALFFAQAALRGFAPFAQDQTAAYWLSETQQLIADIEDAMRKQRG